jgi:hypothetical protein
MYGIHSYIVRIVVDECLCCDELIGYGYMVVKKG